MAEGSKIMHQFENSVQNNFIAVYISSMSRNQNLTLVDEYMHINRICYVCKHCPQWDLKQFWKQQVWKHA